MNLKRPEWTEISAGGKPASPISRRRPVYLRMGDAWVQVRTFGPEGKDAFAGNVESITAALPPGTDLKPGDWVRFEQRHVFSACICHE